MVVAFIAISTWTPTMRATFAVATSVCRICACRDDQMNQAANATSTQQPRAVAATTRRTTGRRLPLRCSTW